MFNISTLYKNVFSTKAVFLNEEDVLITSVEHDTRRIQKGALYVAIRGDNHDGHDFVKDAQQKGAVACLVDHKIDDVDIPQIIVPDTIYAYGDLANSWRKRIKYPIIGLTGSNGKTTTKDILFTILSYKHRVFKTQGNFNNLIGVPYTILSFPLDGDYGIVEMGMNATGEIYRLAEITNPDIGIITNIGRAHIGKLGSIDSVFSAKMELFNYMMNNNKSFFVINLSDKMISDWVLNKDIKKKISFSCSGLNDADVNVEQVSDSSELQRFKITLKNGESKIGEIKLSGIHNLCNVAAGIVTASHFGIHLNECIKALEFFVPPSMRSNMVVKNGIKYLIDCYNANPDSMIAAIETGVKVSNVKRRIAVIGDMLELDDFSPVLHEEIGELLGREKYDYVFAVGQYAKDYKKGFLKKSSADKISVYKSKDILILKKDLISFIKSGDFVLIKASRGMKLETILD
ncbi:MAG: UDP-N-acetylmuramoyl-tripeptide--D-alanyl-D-alanine ligase [Proteobacteria bacterium]|nr:UDP-N-acetylmuramoyl-tripeptide--D-alanyl-D-alanine ligase [Pseudomonadota bacterium]